MGYRNSAYAGAGVKVVCICLPKHGDARSLAEIFYQATPQIQLRHNEAVFLEISKCQHLYSAATFLKRVQVTLNRIGLTARIGMAEDIPTALAMTLHPVAEKKFLPIDCLPCYCDPLGQYPEHTPLISKAIHVLRSLRIYTIKDFLDIPAGEITLRFGPSLLLAHQRLQGEHPLIWNIFEPRQIVQEDHEFDLTYPPRDLEPVYFILRPLLEKIFLRLRGKGRRMRQFKIILQQEYATQKTPQSYEVHIAIPLPFVSLKTIFQITKEKLDASVQKKPLEHAIVQLSLVVTEDGPYMTSQKDIFDQKKEETSESFFHLVSRLATKLGPESVFFAHLKESYLPEKNWLRATDKCHPDIQSTAVPERPLRLFKKPLPISIQSCHFSYNRKTYEIREWRHPEVLLSNWWEIAGGERIYTKLITHNGDQFWVFKNRDVYYLHGVFE
ncbi:MAG: hypothetical protein JNL11_05810 [Bdellovibrionaceae bacterium]|nr:hypothetical protein [Pseudobdellovibrionaceae bacterium]